MLQSGVRQSVCTAACQYKKNTMTLINCVVSERRLRVGSQTVANRRELFKRDRDDNNNNNNNIQYSAWCFAVTGTENEFCHVPRRMALNGFPLKSNIRLTSLTHNRTCYRTDFRNAEWGPSLVVRNAHVNVTGTGWYKNTSRGLTCVDFQKTVCWRWTSRENVGKMYFVYVIRK